MQPERDCLHFRLAVAAPPEPAESPPAEVLLLPEILDLQKDIRAVKDQLVAAGLKLFEHESHTDKGPALADELRAELQALKKRLSDHQASRTQASSDTAPSVFGTRHVPSHDVPRQEPVPPANAPRADQPVPPPVPSRLRNYILTLVIGAITGGGGMHLYQGRDHAGTNSPASAPAAIGSHSDANVSSPGASSGIVAAAEAASNAGVMTRGGQSSSAAAAGQGAVASTPAPAPAIDPAVEQRRRALAAKARAERAAAITTSVQEQLAANNLSKIRAEVSPASIVKLTGTVATSKEKELAAKIAQDVKDIQGVQDLVVIDPSLRDLLTECKAGTNFINRTWVVSSCMRKLCRTAELATVSQCRTFCAQDEDCRR